MTYEAVAITDHADSSTMDFIIPRIIKVASELNQVYAMRVIPGIELTHIPPKLIGSMVERARELGARIVVIHGESIVEPVAPGTNLAGLKAGADIIAHPGLITRDEVSLAADKGIYLELTARSGHSLTNGHVARMAQEAGAKLLLNSDAHAPGDLMEKGFAEKVADGAGLPEGSLDNLLSNARELVEKLGYLP